VKIVYMNAQAERVEAELMAGSDNPLLLVTLDNGVTLEIIPTGNDYTLGLRRADGRDFAAIGDDARIASGVTLLLQTEVRSLGA
jgi:hypothetical protein